METERHTCNQSSRGDYKKRGLQPRLNQNRLVFLCADTDAVSSVYDNARRWLAWKSIDEDRYALNLDQHRIKEAEKNRAEYDDRLRGVIIQAYKWVLSPAQNTGSKQELCDLHWEEQKITSGETSIIPAVARVLAENEILIPGWSPIHLSNYLRMWYLKDERTEQSLQGLWNDFCRYLYLPRLRDSDVLKDTVEAGVRTKDFFGYASGKENDRYLGLVFGTPGKVYLDDSSLVVRKDAARKQLDAEIKPVPPLSVNDDLPDSVNDFCQDWRSAPAPGEKGTLPDASRIPDTPEVSAGSKKLPTRFHGSVSLNPVNAGLQFSDIMQEIVQHFSGKIGAEISITVEIDAKYDKGFDDAICRTVKENSTTLGFSIAEFEEE